MFCRKCGHKLNDFNNFCGHCGEIKIKYLKKEKIFIINSKYYKIANLIVITSLLIAILMIIFFSELNKNVI